MIRAAAAALLAVSLAACLSSGGVGGSSGDQNTAVPQLEVSRSTSCSDWSSWPQADRVRTAGEMADRMGAFNTSDAFDAKLARMLLTAYDGAPDSVKVEEAAASLATIDRKDLS